MQRFRDEISSNALWSVNLFAQCFQADNKKLYQALVCKRPEIKAAVHSGCLPRGKILCLLDKGLQSFTSEWNNKKQ